MCCVNDVDFWVFIYQVKLLLQLGDNGMTLSSSSHAYCLTSGFLNLEGGGEGVIESDVPMDCLRRAIKSCYVMPAFSFESNLLPSFWL